MRVPNVDAREHDPEVTIMPKGEYTCRIVDIGIPKPSMTREYMLHMRFTLEVVDGEFAGRRVYEYYAGWIAIVRMVYANRTHFIGQVHQARIRIVEYKDQKYNDAMLRWEYDATASSEDTD